MFFMLLFFLVGIRRVEHKISCTVFSLLIHYFTMASVAWMGAEAVLMFHKLIIVFGYLHLTVISVIAWGERSCSSERRTPLHKTHTDKVL